MRNETSLALLISYCITAGWAAGMEPGVKHPVYAPQFGESDIPKLTDSVRKAMDMPLDELMRLVPEQSGIFFSGCPHCDGGSQENGVLSWEPGMGDKVKCNYCSMLFPNEQYPNNAETTITAMDGTTQQYRWHENKEGRQYHFQGRNLFDRYKWAENMAYRMANLYALTRDNAYGQRAAAIVGRFAQFYPHYAIRFDYPFKPVLFYPPDQKYPYEEIKEPYRGAKYYWWGYGDIPQLLARAYDLLVAGGAFDLVREPLGEDIEQRIEQDLLQLSYEFVTANPDTQSNMMPGTYQDMVVVGRVLGDPSMVHTAIQGFRGMLRDKFFSDGWWCEGAPSYHMQTIGNMRRVAESAKGYSDPPAWDGDERFVNLDLEVDEPMLAAAIKAGREGVLPDGRLIPINDTWSTSKLDALAQSTPKLWPALGHAVLGMGEGDKQIQAHVNWSTAYGHSHADNASIILWAHGHELASDIGYTHTRYRNWTINTASHNTVVVDERSQDMGQAENRGGGNLLFFDGTNPHVQTIYVDASKSYPACSVYQRLLVLIDAGDGRYYVADLFDVEGGSQHDWFMHGSADEPGAFEASLSLETPVTTLVPSWGGTEEHLNEQHADLSGETRHAYMFLENIMAGAAEGAWHADWRYADGAGLRTHGFAELGSMAYRFRSPAIRGADKVDADLPKYHRYGLMIRRKTSTSRFAAVHEPFKDTPWIDEIAFEDGKFTVTHDGRQETIIWKMGRLTVESTAGWRYDSGEPRTGNLVALERDGGFTLHTDIDATGADFIRLNLGVGQTIGCAVASAEGGRIVLANDPGIALEENGEARMVGFPKDVYDGPHTVTAYVGGN